MQRDGRGRTEAARHFYRISQAISLTSSNAAHDRSRFTRSDGLPFMLSTASRTCNRTGSGTVPRSIVRSKMPAEDARRRFQDERVLLGRHRRAVIEVDGERGRHEGPSVGGVVRVVPVELELHPALLRSSRSITTSVARLRLAMLSLRIVNHP